MSPFGRFRHRRPRTAAGSRIYAIGDVHGRYDLLCSLFDIIHDHLAGADPQPKQVHLILLGDVVDRGSESRECLEVISRESKQNSLILLRGNHEDMMLQAAHANPRALEAWLEQGGLATLESFAISPPTPEEDTIDFAERLRDGVSDAIWECLESTPTSWSNGNYLFVHAGVKPNVSLAAQDENDLLSIRDAFTTSSDWHDALVVHGHSVVDFVELRPNRIACDTGAWHTNRLSCVCLDGEMQTVLST